MRRTRRLLLLCIAVIVASVVFTYRFQRARQAREAPAPPVALAEGITSKTSKYRYTQTDGDRKIVDVFADELQQVAEASRFQLTGVELHIYHKDQKAYDKVRSAHADFDTSDGVMYSDGEVEITMGVAAEGQPPGRLLTIKSSGVRFESKTGRAHTDRAASFTFDRGEGRSTGANYDPHTRELRMHRDVELKWRGTKPTDQPMVVTSGSLVYREAESKVYLTPWAKLVRGSMTLEAADSVVTLVDGTIRLVEGSQAKGADVQQARKLEYAAEQLRMDFAENGAIHAISGAGNARLVSTTSSGATITSANQVDLSFDSSKEDSVLLTARSTGKSVVESHPAAQPGKPAPDVRILRSEVVLLTMRAGGEEIDRVETETPGTLEFVPKSPASRHRLMNAERMWITYGARNQIESFRAVSVSTRTEAEDGNTRKPAAPMTTASRDLLANFDPDTGQMTRLEQWNDFQYEEGPRKARASKATMEPGKSSIVLEGQARVWDQSGSTAANRIQLDQKTNDFDAVGNVDSTRLPEKKKGGGLMSGEDAMQARAQKMTARNNNQEIRYEGSAVIWQGGNQITGDRVDIDRAKRTLRAHGRVVTRFLEQDEASKRKPVVTVVRAPDLVYTDADKLAHYTGGAQMLRPALHVQSREIRAWLKETGEETRVDRAVADGAVKIVESAPDRTRTGTGEHAEYDVAEGKVVLNGGSPQLVDSRRGTARGKQLTWFSNNDRLLVDGAEAQPAVSNIKRK